MSSPIRSQLRIVLLQLFPKVVDTAPLGCWGDPGGGSSLHSVGTEGRGGIKGVFAQRRCIFQKAYFKGVRFSQINWMRLLFGVNSMK